MTESKDLILNELFDAVFKGDAQKARRATAQVVAEGVSANVALEKMTAAIDEADAKYMRNEYGTADVAAASTAMREAFKILEPHLKVKPVNLNAKIVLGSLKGNIQGLGKDIVAATLRSAGFQVLDLGVDVSPENFVTTAQKEGAQVIAVSVSVDETVPFLKDIVKLLRENELDSRIKTVIGGRAVSEHTCKEYNIGACAKDAWDCVVKVRQLLSS